MTARWSWFVLLAIGWTMAGALVGCGKNEPTERFNRDLGDSNRPLPPAFPAKTEPELASGRAEWVEFVPPGEKPAITASTPQEAAVRELIDEVNAVIADGDFDALPGYYVEEQQELAEQAFTFAQGLIERSEPLISLLTEKATEEQKPLVDQIAVSLGQMTGGDGFEALQIQIDEIEVVNESEVIVTTKADPENPAVTSERLQFLLVDDEWYVKSPEMAQMAPMLPGLNMLLTTLDTQMEMLKNDQMDVNAFMMSFGAAMMQIQMGAQAAMQGAADGQAEMEAGGEAPDMGDLGGGFEPPAAVPTEAAVTLGGGEVAEGIQYDPQAAEQVITGSASPEQVEEIKGLMAQLNSLARGGKFRDVSSAHIDDHRKVCLDYWGGLDKIVHEYGKVANAITDAGGDASAAKAIADGLLHLGDLVQLDEVNADTLAGKVVDGGCVHPVEFRRDGQSWRVYFSDYDKEDLTDAFRYVFRTAKSDVSKIGVRLSQGEIEATEAADELLAKLQELRDEMCSMREEAREGKLKPRRSTAPMG
jgi:hypothetical protein